jgi:dihydrofolate reductase
MTQGGLMSKLILWNVMTLDGFFDGAQCWKLDWHQTVLNDEFHNIALEQLRGAEALLFGRVTYEGMAAYWQTANGETAEYMNKLPKYVFSKTLQRADWANTTLIAGDAVAAVERIKERATCDLFVFGSGRLSAAFLEAELFDEVRIALAPVVIGHGQVLFGRGLNRISMKHLESRTLSNGCVILRYQPQSQQ